MTLVIEAPTDAQLGYIGKLCTDRGLRAPEVVVSKQEASQIIEAIRGGTYGANDYTFPWNEGTEQ